MSSHRYSLEEIVVRPPGASRCIDLKEIVHFRALLWSMSRRQVKSEFGDLHLGIFWVLARPVLMTIIFVFFRHASGANTGVAIPYVGYLYSGLILWFFFTESVIKCAGSINNDGVLMKKIYYPRLLSPMSAILAQISTIAIAAIPLVMLMLWLGIVPDWHVLFFPLVLLHVMALALGVGCLFAALSTTSRDWGRFLSLLLYVGLFLSPVIFAPDMLPPVARTVQMFNPMSGLLLTFRAVLFRDFPFPLNGWLFSLCSTLVLMLAGIWAFNRAERTFMDKI